MLVSFDREAFDLINTDEHVHSLTRDKKQQGDFWLVLSAVRLKTSVQVNSRLERICAHILLVLLVRSSVYRFISW